MQSNPNREDICNGNSAAHPPLLDVLSTEDEIEAAIGKPAPRVLSKVLGSLDDICRAFIARSPFVVVASSDSQGHFDLSPKGDLQIKRDRTCRARRLAP
jgi:hypothetical protein